jgi:HEAT repeat protein
MNIFSCFNVVRNILDHGDVESKVTLAKNGDQKILCDLSYDDSEVVRMEVAKRMNEAANNCLMEGWQDESPKVLYLIAAGGFSLKKLSRHSSPYVREGVIFGIERLGKDQVKTKELDILDRLSRDPSPDVRRIAVRACAYYTPHKLKYFLNDPSPEVRRAVVRYGNRDLVEMLKSDSDYYVRMEAYEILRGSHWN